MRSNLQSSIFNLQLLLDCILLPLIFCFCERAESTISPNWTPVRQCRSVGIKIANGRLPIYGISEWYGSVFTWMPSDNLNARSGGALTCTRATNTTSLRPDGTLDFVPANTLGADHYIGGAVTYYPGYRTSPDQWTCAVNSNTDSGVLGRLGKNMYLFKGTGNGNHAHASAAWTPADTTVYRLIVGVRKYNTTDMILIYPHDGMPYWTYKFSTNTAVRLAGTGTFIGATTFGNVTELEFSCTSQAGMMSGFSAIAMMDSGETTWTFDATADPNKDRGVIVDYFYITQTAFKVPLSYPSPETNAAYAGAATLLTQTFPKHSTGLRLYVLKSNHAESSDVGAYAQLDDMLSNATTRRNQIYFIKATPNIIEGYSFDHTKTINLTSASVMADKSNGYKCAFLYNYSNKGARVSALSELGNYGTIANADDHSLNSAYVHTYSVGDAGSGGGYSINANMKSVLCLGDCGLLTEIECRNLMNALLRVSP